MAARNCSRCSAISIQERRIAGRELFTPPWCRKLIKPLASELGKTFEGPVKRLEAAVDLLEPLRTEIDRTAVMAG